MLNATGAKNVAPKTRHTISKERKEKYMIRNKWIFIGLIFIVLIIIAWAVVTFVLPLTSSPDSTETIVPVVMPNSKPTNTVNLPDKFFTVDNQGVINLYDTNSKKVADTADFKLVTQTSSVLVGTPTDVINIVSVPLQDEDEEKNEQDKEEPPKDASNKDEQNKEEQDNKVDDIKTAAPETKENTDSEYKPSTESIVNDIVIMPFEDLDDKYYQGFEKVKVKIRSGDTAWGIQRKLTSDKDLVKIMKFVKEVNEGRALHPIYPDEVLVFLKVIGDVVPEAPQPPVPEEPPVSEEPPSTPSPIPEPMMPSFPVNNEADEDVPPFLYATSEDNKVLYVYGKDTKTFYTVSATDYKLEIKTLFTCLSVPSFVEFKAAEGSLFALSADKLSMAKLSIDNQTAPTLYNFDTPIDVWEISKNYLYYCSGENLGQINLLTNVNLNTQLGDTSNDIFLLNNKLYVLNQFGSGLENSILIKMHPITLLVEGLIELKNTNNTVFQNIDNDIIYIGQKSNTATEIISITAEPFEISEKKFVLNYEHKPINIQNFIFNLEDNKAIIYDTTGKSLWEIPVSGDNIIVLE